MRLAIAAPAVLAVLAGAAAAAPAPYDASVAASAAAEQSLFGPLDGAWRLAGPRGVGLYRFELADPAAEARQLQGAWRAEAAPGRSGVLETARRRGDGLILAFRDGDRLVRVRLRPGPQAGAWRGVLDDGSRRAVVAMRRP
ncbi:MAG: hypothetical protein IIZ63_16285 [Caulobacteraceae bacterium]|nr:hypothetical protein [Caulobacteraceae bacterium]